MDYKSKRIDYYTNARLDLLDMVDWPIKRVLEIGCGSGATINVIRDSYPNVEVKGIELNKIAEIKEQDFILYGDFMTMALPTDFNNFDTVILADVLEHINGERQALLKIFELMKGGARLVISVPNVRHIDVLKNVFIKGTFPRNERGLFDRTHVNFYCRKDLVTLLKDSGFDIVRIQRSSKYRKLRGWRKFLSILPFEWSKDLVATQIFVIAMKP